MSAGFMVKVPLFPFHTWLPLTYSEAPSPVSMALTGVMSKLGVYGFVRLLLPIFPEPMQTVLTPLLWLAVATIVLSAFAALAQRDLKRILAYSSINHLGYCLLAVFAVALSPAGAHAAAASADSLRALDPLAAVHAAFTPTNQAYARLHVALQLLTPWVGIVAGLLLLSTRLSALFASIAHGLGRHSYVRALVYVTLYLVAMTLLTLPFDWFQDHHVERQFGLSTQSLGDWLLDGLKSLVVGIITFGVLPLGLLVWSVLRASPRGWWIRLAAATLPFTLIAVLLQPIVLDPLFHHYRPLQDASLRGDILGLAQRAGIPGRKVFEVDMSKTVMEGPLGEYTGYYTPPSLKPVGRITRTSASPPAPSSNRLIRLPRLAVAPAKVWTERWKAAWSAARGVPSGLAASPIGPSRQERGVPPEKMRLAALATIALALAEIL